MSASNWQHVTVADYRKLRDARLLAHYGAQWLARAARAYIPASAHDAHTSLGWDGRLRALTTNELPDGSRLALRIPDLTLSIVDSNDALPLDGRAEPEVRAWLGAKLAARGFDAGRLDRPSPYEMPYNAVALGARYSIEELVEPLAAIATWFGNGHAMLSAVREGLLARKLKAPEVRCWPHHFDMDSLFRLGGNRAVGAGFCPGDEFCDEPYFYISIYPEPYIPALPLLPPVAHWHSYKFIAALAPAHKIVASLDQPRDIAAFFDISVNAALEALDRLGKAGARS
jgi:hypothetical protein